MSYGMDGWNKPDGDSISRAAVLEELADLYWTEERFLTFKDVDSVFDRIKALPSAQTEKRTNECTETHDKRTETRVCDCISRKAAIDELNKGAWGVEWDKTLAKTMIESLPSAQPTDADIQKMQDIEQVMLDKAYECGKQDAMQWIPCSERLPRQGQEVICQCRANMIKILKLDACGDWYQDAEHCYMSGFVIAWMSLPETYREVNEQHEST